VSTDGWIEWHFGALSDLMCSPFRWALGVFIFCLLAGEAPFGSVRDSELEIFERITKRELHFPDDFSTPAKDLIDKVRLT
jgi:serine/threonine protein kinase